MRFRLFAGSVRNSKWYNYAECHPLKGGTFAMLDSGDKSGAARLISVLKGSVDTFYTEDGEELKLTPADYNTIKVADSWKIVYEQIKLVTKEDFPVIPESFLCTQCSRPKDERYTTINESWQTLIDEGLITENYLDEPLQSFIIELPTPFTIEPKGVMAGGTFRQIKMQHLTVGDMLSVHKNSLAMETEANMACATWDTCLVEVVGMQPKDLNVLKRMPYTFFSKTYFTDIENQQAIIDAFAENGIGRDATGRSISCRNCGADVCGGSMDFSNFFLPLLPKKSTRSIM